jgi:hypothetical protein
MVALVLVAVMALSLVALVATPACWLKVASSPWEGMLPSPVEPTDSNGISGAGGKAELRARTPKIENKVGDTNPHTITLTKGENSGDLAVDVAVAVAVGNLFIGNDPTVNLT